MAKEIKIGNLGVRIFKGCNSLTEDEKTAINTVIGPLLGYDDVDELARENGFDTADDMARYYSYSNPRDFFLSHGYARRLKPFQNNNSNHDSD
ncbi:MAG: hypothetical protein KKF48_05570 [Nanoarchaeota archaeon]|nr:hypothetical protein [Nanoarchaeota archaeon]MBU1028486.1 hypothetical protein [Nanoarchaeota archaeon]